MLQELARWIASTSLSETLAGSIWAYPLIAAFHVLGVAWFGGAVLVDILRPGDPDARPRPGLLWTAAIFMSVTGLLLFIAEPHRALTSQFLRLKLLLLMVLALTYTLAPKLPSKLRISLSLILWAAVILASRGIAFL